MSPAQAIANYLAAQGVGVLGATSGWAIAVSTMPDDCPDTIALYDLQGQAPDTDEMDIHREVVEVRVRARYYTEGYAKQQEIFNKLVPPRPAPSMDITFMGIFAQSSILALGRDDGDRHMLTINYRTIRRV